jgi:hypothetical protein
VLVAGCVPRAEQQRRSEREEWWCLAEGSYSSVPLEPRQNKHFCWNPLIFLIYASLIHWFGHGTGTPKIKTRLIDEKFASVKGECVI